MNNIQIIQMTYLLCGTIVPLSIVLAFLGIAVTLFRKARRSKSFILYTFSLCAFLVLSLFLFVTSEGLVRDTTAAFNRSRRQYIVGTVSSVRESCGFPLYVYNSKLYHGCYISVEGEEYYFPSNYGLSAGQKIYIVSDPKCNCIYDWQTEPFAATDSTVNIDASQRSSDAVGKIILIIGFILFIAGIEAPRLFGSRIVHKIITKDLHVQGKIVPSSIGVAFGLYFLLCFWIMIVGTCIKFGIDSIIIGILGTAWFVWIIHMNRHNSLTIDGMYIVSSEHGIRKQYHINREITSCDIMFDNGGIPSLVIYLKDGRHLSFYQLYYWGIHPMCAAIREKL